LVVIASVFDEDSDLKKKFLSGKHTSKMLYNTLTPIFNEGFEIGIQMDTNIFEYLKNKKAIFEVRHYIIDQEKKNTATQMSNHKSESSLSQVSQYTDENEDKELMNVRPINAKNAGPNADWAKECTELTTPVRVIKVPNSISE